MSIYDTTLGGSRRDTRVGARAEYRVEHCDVNYSKSTICAKRIQDSVWVGKSHAATSRV